MIARSGLMAPWLGYWIKTVHFRHQTLSAQTTARSQMIGRLEHHEDLFKDGRPWFTEWEGTPSALYESSEEAIKGIGRVCLVRVCLFLIGCWADWLSGCVVEGKRRTCPRGPMDKASAYEAGDCGFESRRRLFSFFNMHPKIPGSNPTHPLLLYMFK